MSMDEHAEAQSVDESTSMTHQRQRSRSRCQRCWHCGHTGHIRRRCFRRMRHQRRRGRDAGSALTVDSEVDSVAEYACDGQVTFLSSVPSDYFQPTGCTLSSRWLLDADATFHVTPHRDWFSSFSSGRLGCVHMADGSVYDIEGAGDVCMSLPSGASYTLRHVRYVPGLCQSLISVSQLRDVGCRVTLDEHCFRMQCGSLVIARGGRSALVYPMYVTQIRPGLVSVTLQSCRQRDSRCISFADELQDAQTLVEHVQCLSIERHVESTDSSMAALQGQSSVLVTDLAIEPYTEVLSYDADDAFEVDSDPDAAVQDLSAVELASFIWEIDCSGAALSVLQSVSDMPLPDDADMVMHGQVVPEDAYSTEVADRDRLAEIVHVSSAFGSLVYDLLVSRPDLGAAVVALAVGVVSRTVADTGIVHGGALQVLTRYLHEVHVCSSSVAHSEWSLERIQVHARTWSEPVGVG